MDVFEAIYTRRSIRKYQERQIPREDLEKILEAGTFAPNAGGGQRTVICGIRNRSVAASLGAMNLARFDRSRLAGGFVSKEQPSAIDDPAIKNGFYGAPAVCVVFAQDHFLYSVPDAFCCAQNMVLAARALGISSCIVARAEETFDNPVGRQLMERWNIPKNYIPRCFVTLGYIDGEYPAPRERKEGRLRVIDEDWR